MDQKKIDKRYIYERDEEKCYHCSKPLRYNKTTLDHYFPRSLGGTEEVFNLVSCCKQCNRLKRSIVPKDWVQVNVKLLQNGIENGKIKSVTGITETPEEIKHLSKSVKSVFRNRINTVFEGTGVRIYVKENKIYKIVKFRHDEHQIL